jgi:hypothetical protein
MVGVNLDIGASHKGNIHSSAINNCHSQTFMVQNIISAPSSLDSSLISMHSFVACWGTILSNLSC